VSYYDRESSGSESPPWDEYSSVSRKASKETASAYMSVIKHCLGDALPEGYGGSEPMEVSEAAAYVRSHITRTRRQYVKRFTAEYNGELDKHYQESCKETEQMMQEHGL
jgi:uncharacterized damage-inducible protein DinB